MKLRLILLLVIIIGGLMAWPTQRVQRLIESEPPKVGLQKAETLGVGALASAATMTVSDNVSGVRSVSVTLVQQNRRSVLLEQEFNPPVTSEKLEFKVPGAEAGFEEGDAHLEILARDATWRANEVALKYSIPVDRTPPRVSIMSQQHIGKQGGSQLIVYKVMETKLKECGVWVQDYFFPAVPAHVLEAGYANQPDVFISLFAIPLGFDAAKDVMEIRARDGAGNDTKIPFRFQIKNYNQANTTPALTDAFLQRKVAELLPGYAAMSKQALQTDALVSEDLAANFKLINEDYRALLDDKLRNITREVTPEIYWKEPFQRPLAAATSSNFGEKRAYRYNGKDISHSIHLGFDLASVNNDSVKAANAGKIVYSGDLGIYGNTVIINHGMGLHSLYAHLSSLLVGNGDTVTLGQEVGRTGETGLAGGDHLHFEFRLGAVSVWAVEWWDPNWLEDQFWGKIRLPSAENLEKQT